MTTGQQSSDPKLNQTRSGLQALADLSLRVKLIVVFLAVTLFSVGLISFLNLRTTNAALTNQVGNGLASIAELEAHIISTVLAEQVISMQGFEAHEAVLTSLRTQNAAYQGSGEVIVTEMANLDKQWVTAGDDAALIQGRLNNEVAQELREYMRSNPGFAEAFLTDRYGALVAAGDRTSDYYQADEEWWQAAFRDGQGAVYIGRPEFDESAEVLSLNMATPLHDPGSGEVIGVLRATFDLSWLVKEFLKIEETSKIEMLFPDGEIFSDYLGQDYQHELVDAATLAQLDASPERYVRVVWEGNPSLVAVADIGSSTDEKYISDLGWKIVVHQDESKALAPVTQQSRALGLLALVVAAVSIVVAIGLGHVLASPITHLTSVVAHFTTGDLSARVHIGSRDETGVLAASFNQMAEQVGDLLKSLQARSTELEERTRELEASQRVTFAASERVSPNELLSLVVNLIRDQFNLYHVQVYTVDEDQGAAVLRESTGYAGRQLLQRGHHIPLDTERSLVVKAIREGQPVLVDDVSRASDFMPNPLLPDTRSELVVPLKVGGRVLGALDAQDRTADRFSESTVVLFQTMADQVSFLFENSELLQRVTQQTETLTLFTNQLRTAADIARRLGTILDPERLLEQVVEMIQSRFGLYHAHIYVLDEKGGRLIVRAGSGEVGRVLHERGHSIPLDTKKSLVARAVRSKETVLVNDTSLESGFMPNPLLPQTRSEVAVPLVVGDQVLGVLDVQDDQAGRFNQAELDTFNTLAGQVAITLQTAHLFEERKQMEAALRTSEEYYRGVIESQQDAIVRVDPEGRFTFVNDVYCRKFGKTREELLGNTFTPLIHEDDLQPTLDAMQALYVPPYRARMEQRAMTGEGWRWFEWEDHSILDEQGNIVEIQGVGRDITERKQAEEAVRESQQMLQLIMNNIPQSIFWKDQDGVFLGCNQGVVQDAGLASIDEIIGKTDFDMPWAEQAELYRADDRRVMESGETVLNYEEPQTAPDGTRVWLRTSKIPLRDAQDKVWAVLGIYEDITERKQAEQAMHESEERFRGLYEASPLGIILNDFEKGTYLAANDAFLDMVGYTIEELNQLSYFDLTPKKYTADEDRQMDSMLKTGRFGPYEKEYIRKDGIAFPVVLNGVVVTDSMGRKMIWSTVEDITERKRAEEEREHFTSQLRTAAELAGQINAILDPDQLLPEVVTQLQARFHLYHVHVYLLDSETRELLMRAGSGEAGHILREQGHKIPLERGHSLVARAARARQIIHAADTRQEPDFMPNPLLPDTRSEVAMPLVAGDKVLGVLDVQDDQAYRFTPSDLDVFATLAGQVATALQNAGLFEEIQRAAERLREVDRLKSEFLANMSHELRTPLNSILGYTEIMLMGLSGDLDPETLEDAQAIFDNGQHLLRLINDILDLAKIEAGRMTLNLEAVEIAPLLEEVKTSSAGLLVNKPVELGVEVPEDLPLIQADRLRLSQILNNLMSNAAKFTQEGSIILRACRENGWVCLEVEDTGIGIKESDLETIFEQFRQADGSFKRRAEGTGLGLAITRHLVAMHGGTIQVRSQVGQGSTFAVRLPVQVG